MQKLFHEGTVVKGKRSCKHFEDDTIRETVRYILQSNNIQLLSWGTRRLYVDGQRRQFPVLVRKASIDVMWRNYTREKFSYPSGVKKLIPTLFCDIVTKLTRGDVKQRACIDYKLHGLVYENVKMLRRIVDDHVRDCNKRKELKRKMKGVIEFLKYSYITHLDDTSTDPFHNVKFGIGHGKFNAETKKVVCSEFNAVFKMVHELKSEIIDQPPCLNEIIDNSAKKFEVFMGHIVQKHVQ